MMDKLLKMKKDLEVYVDSLDLKKSFEDKELISKTFLTLYDLITSTTKLIGTVINKTCLDNWAKDEFEDKEFFIYDSLQSEIDKYQDEYYSDIEDVSDELRSLNDEILSEKFSEQECIDMLVILKEILCLLSDPMEEYLIMIDSDKYDFSSAVEGMVSTIYEVIDEIKKKSEEGITD